LFQPEHRILPGLLVYFNVFVFLGQSCFGEPQQSQSITASKAARKGKAVDQLGYKNDHQLL